MLNPKSPTLVITLDSTRTADPIVLQRIISVKLAAQGFESTNNPNDEILEVASDLFRVYREQSRLLEHYRPPIDQRIQAFLEDVFKATGDPDVPQLPHQTLAVDRYGLARELSFPQGANEFHNSEIDSYRLTKNGVLHNPINGQPEKTKLGFALKAMLANVRPN